MSRIVAPMQERVCFRCGHRFARGELGYLLRVEMVADFDGYIDGDRLVAPSDAGFEEMTLAAERSEEQLSDEVYRERTILCCNPCAETVWATVVSPQPRE
jgi:hypothetical protein